MIQMIDMLIMRDGKELSVFTAATKSHGMTNGND